MAARFADPKVHTSTLTSAPALGLVWILTLTRAMVQRRRLELKLTRTQTPQPPLTLETETNTDNDTDTGTDTDTAWTRTPQFTHHSPMRSYCLDGMCVHSFIALLLCLQRRSDPATRRLVARVFYSDSMSVFSPAAY